MNTISKNKKAFFNYDIGDKYVAGIKLKGSEVKSIKDGGNISFNNSFCFINKGEIFIKDFYIKEYSNSSSYFNHDPYRVRKLLLTKKEIEQIEKKLNNKGVSLIPLNIFLKNSLIKVEIGIGTGRKKYDKREYIKKREDEKKIDKAIKNYK